MLESDTFNHKISSGKMKVQSSPAMVRFSVRLNKYFFQHIIAEKVQVRMVHEINV